MKKIVSMLISLSLAAAIIIMAAPLAFADSMSLTLAADRSSFENTSNYVKLTLSFSGQARYPGVDASLFIPSGVEVVNVSSTTSAIKRRDENRIQFLYEDASGRGVSRDTLGTVTVKLSQGSSLNKDYTFTFMGESATSELETEVTSTGSLTIKGRIITNVSSQPSSTASSRPSSTVSSRPSSVVSSRPSSSKPSSVTTSSHPSSNEPSSNSSGTGSNNGSSDGASSRVSSRPGSSPSSRQPKPEDPVSAVAPPKDNNQAVLYNQPGINDGDQYLQMGDISDGQSAGISNDDLVRQPEQSVDEDLSQNQSESKDQPNRSNTLMWTLIAVGALCVVILVIGIVAGVRLNKTKKD